MYGFDSGPVSLFSVAAMSSSPDSLVISIIFIAPDQLTTLLQYKESRIINHPFSTVTFTQYDRKDPHSYHGLDWYFSQLDGPSEY